MINNKKAQVTLFVIIGIVLLLSITIIIYIRSQLMPPPEPIPDKDVVQVYVEECLLQVSEEALTRTGL